jgi:hypothetical protein
MNRSDVDGAIDGADAVLVALNRPFRRGCHRRRRSHTRGTNHLVESELAPRVTT